MRGRSENGAAGREQAGKAGRRAAAYGPSGEFQGCGTGKAYGEVNFDDGDLRCGQQEANPQGLFPRSPRHRR